MIFNRGYYEDVLATRVHRLVPERIWTQRYNIISTFERTLERQLHDRAVVLPQYSPRNSNWPDSKAAQRSTTLVENLESQYGERDYWSDYMTAFEDVFRLTSVTHASWFIILANHRWLGQLAIAEIIVGATEEDENQRASSNRRL
jgi:polyphosphate kinase 2 (PPK2 family)